MKKEVLYLLLDEYKNVCQIFANVLDAPSRGGNISIKQDEYLLIKSSGEDLKFQHHISILKNGSNILSYFDKLSENIKKPSMEFQMHQLFRNKYVAHYHPVYILPYLCCLDFKFSYPCVDFKMPGKELCDELRRNYIYQECGVIMLRNHGVIVYAECLKDLKNCHKQLRNEFLELNENVFTPDDAVDLTSDELWLFRETIENIARKKHLTLSTIDANSIYNIINLSDEKYRQKQMKAKEF